MSFFELPVPPEVLLGLPGRGYCFGPLVKITARNIQAEMKRRRQQIGPVDKPPAFGLCWVLPACRRAFRLPLSPPPTFVARGRGADVSTGPTRGAGVRDFCSQRVVQNQLRHRHLVPPNYTESRTLGVGSPCSHAL